MMIILLMGVIVLCGILMLGYRMNQLERKLHALHAAIHILATQHPDHRKQVTDLLDP